MSSAILILAAVLGADAADSDPSAPRGFHEIGDDIHDVLRSEAQAENLDRRSVAVKKMAAIYEEILKDPRLENSPTLKKYKAKLWSRMTRIKTDLQRKVDRELGTRHPGVNRQEELALKQATQSLAAQMSTINYTMGGPSNVLAHTGGNFGGGARPDHGQELIDLIQRTIAPDFWDTAGGPGSIFYYQPLMALVVSATAEVHGKIGGVLNALRRAGM